MFALIESCPDSRPGFGWTGKAISLAAHAFLISVVAALSQAAAEHVTRGRLQPQVMIWDDARLPAGTRPHVRHLTFGSRLEIPNSLPPVVPDQPLPVLDAPPAVIGTATFGDSSGPILGIVTNPGAMLSTAPVDVNVVEEPPVLLNHPPIRFPEALRQAGITGHVIVETVIDSLGHAEREFTHVLRSAHPLFDAEALDVVMGSRYRPGRVAGRAVRVRVQVPVNFEIR